VAAIRCYHLSQRWSSATYVVFSRSEDYAACALTLIRPFFRHTPRRVLFVNAKTIIQVRSAIFMAPASTAVIGRCCTWLSTMALHQRLPALSSANKVQNWTFQPLLEHSFVVPLSPYARLRGSCTYPTSTKRFRNRATAVFNRQKR